MSAEGLRVPSTAQLLEAVLAHSRNVHLEMDEMALLRSFLDTLSELFPRRFLAVRAVDLRSNESASVCSNEGLRAGIETERIALKRSSIEKTGLGMAAEKSARIRVGSRWDSPFPGVAAGFAVPMVASGELYAVLDVGYPLGFDLSDLDEPLMLPLANHLSAALRNERLHREASALRDYQDRLIEHANALILGVDRHWRITVCNHALCELTGFPRLEVVGKDLRDWQSGTGVQLTKLFMPALGGGRGDSVDVELSTRNGGRVKTVWNVAAIRGRDRIEAVVAVGQDQTRIMSLQSQVIQAEKLATLGQVAAGVVHELNNPLTSISVYASFLHKKYAARGDESIDSEGDVEKLQRITESAQRILRLSRDLVQYASPADNELAVVSLNQVVEQSLSFCEHLFSVEGVQMEYSLAEDLPSLYAIPGQLEQVVINLVTNAVQALDGEGTVRISTDLAEDGWVRLEVADDGPGIAPGQIHEIFEPFFTTKRDGRGTGLGLSIVSNIVEQHAGRVTTEPSRSGGASFVVLLPAIRGGM